MVVVLILQGVILSKPHEGVKKAKLESMSFELFKNYTMSILETFDFKIIIVLVFAYSPVCSTDQDRTHAPLKFPEIKMQ